MDEDKQLMKLLDVNVDERYYHLRFDYEKDGHIHQGVEFHLKFPYQNNFVNNMSPETQSAYLVHVQELYENSPELQKHVQQTAERHLNKGLSNFVNLDNSRIYISFLRDVAFDNFEDLMTNRSLSFSIIAGDDDRNLAGRLKMLGYYSDATADWKFEHWAQERGKLRDDFDKTMRSLEFERKGLDDWERNVKMSYLFMGGLIEKYFKPEDREYRHQKMKELDESIKQVQQTYDNSWVSDHVSCEQVYQYLPTLSKAYGMDYDAPKSYEPPVQKHVVMDFDIAAAKQRDDAPEIVFDRPMKHNVENSFGLLG